MKNKSALKIGIGLALVLMFGCSSRMENVSLNGEWHFTYDHADEGVEAQWYATTVDSWEKIAVPGFFDDGDYDGTVWYATTLPKVDGKYRWALTFKAVDDNVDIYVDGEFRYRHEGWGELFWLEVTEDVTLGSPAKLVVRLEDTGGPGGLIDDIWLQPFKDEKELAKVNYGEMEALIAPVWAREAVVYEVFVRDFHPDGTFTGLQSKLDELKDLGVDLIWLMPIYPIGEIERKGPVGSPYSIKDYYAINPDMGTGEDFRALVEALHARGMRIILDMVPNHTAWDNAMITDHPEWYTHDENGEIVPPNADWKDVADLNFDVPELRIYLQDMLKFWIETYDIDGYRIDVAEMMPSDFWAETMPKLQKIKPDVFMLAEGNKPYLHVNGFHATYGFNTFPVLIKVANGEQAAQTLHDVMEREFASYPKGALRLRFVENHDQIRGAKAIKTRSGLEAAIAATLFLPGAPLFYNGAESAIDRRLELFHKEAIDWASGSESFRNRIKALLALRRMEPGLLKGGYSPIKVENRAVLAFRRNDIMVVINFGGEDATVELAAEEVIFGDMGVAYTGSQLFLPPGTVALLK